MSGISPFNSNFFNPFTSRLNLAKTGDWSSFVRDVQSEYKNSFLDLSREDYFSDDKNPKINDLFKSIAAQTADELLDLGYEKDMAITRSVEEYIKGLSIGKNTEGPVAQTNKNLVVTDQAGQSSFLNYQDITGNTLDLSAGISDDVINLGGDKNLVILNLEEGDNLVNIEDDKDSDFVVLGGSGEDKIQLAGNISDYQFTDNGDGTLTIKNLISDATTTVDDSIGEIGLNDGSKLVFKDGKLTIEASENADVLNLNGDNTTYQIDSLDGYDSVYIGGDSNNITATLGDGKDMAYIDGSNNIVNLNLGEQRDRVYIASGDNNVINIDGGTYTDKIILQGQESDWTVDGAGTYVNSITGTTVSLSNTEKVYFADDVTEAQETTSNIDLTTYENSSLVLNVSDLDDVINAGGIDNDMVINLEEGNNTVNIDDSSVNVFYVNAEEGDNTINLTGDLGDYRFQDNKNGTYTVTNINSFAQIIVDSDVNNVKMADESVVKFDGEKFTIDGTIYANSVNIDGDGNTYTVNTLNGDDDVYVGGENNNVDILLHNDNDSVFVAVGKDNNITIDGAHGTDSIVLQGMAEDWALKGDGSAGSYYTNLKSGTKVTLYTGIEDVTFDNAIVYYDIEDNSAALDYTGYDDTSFVINTADKDDVINFDGTGNTAEVNLVAGDNTVNIDDTEASTYTIMGGTGNDTLNLVDDFSNYDVEYNGDMVTLTNTVSGAIINLDPYTMETITFNGEVKDPLELDGVTIDGTSDDDTLNVHAYDGETVTINTYEGNDTVNVSGLGNETTINVLSGESTINIDDSEMSTYTVNGGSDNDSVVLTGNVADYTVVDNGDGTHTITNNVSGTTIDINNVELVEVQDGVLLGDAGTVTTNVTLLKETVTIDGTTGDDKFAIDATDGKNYIINGSDGSDEVTLSGSASDWSFDRDTDTYTHNTTGQSVQINSVETVSYEDSSDTIDIHSSAASLLGVTTDFNKLVAEEGASAGFAQLSDIYGQIATELTDQGLTDQALMFDKLRSSTHNMSVVAADYEEMILATGGDVTALESLYYDDRNDAFVKPDDWDDTYYSFEANTNRGSVANMSYATFAVGYAVNDVWDTQDCLDKDYQAWEVNLEYENIMADASVSQDVKDLATDLFSSTGGMAESFQSVVSDIVQKEPGFEFYNSVYDVVTGEEYHTKLPGDTTVRYEDFTSYDAFNVTGFTGSLQSLATGEDYSTYTATTGNDNLEITSSFTTVAGLDMLAGDDNVNITAHNTTVGSTGDRLDLGDGADTLSLSGLNTDVYADMGAGDDTIFIGNASPLENTVKSLDVLGGDGNDLLVLEGESTDWTYNAANSTYSSFNNETIVKIDSIENVIFSNDVTHLNGTAGDDIIDATGHDFETVEVNAGTGTDTVTLDNTVATTYNINDAEEIQFTGNFSDYTISNFDGVGATFTNDVTGSTVNVDWSTSNSTNLYFEDMMFQSTLGSSSLISPIPTAGQDTFVIDDPTDFERISFAHSSLTYDDKLVIDESVSNWTDAGGYYADAAGGSDMADIYYGTSGTIEFSDLVSVRADTDEDVNLSSAIGTGKDVQLSGGDNITLAGSNTDWTFDGTDTYTNNVSGQTVTIEAGSYSGIVMFADDPVVIDGTSGNDDITLQGYDNQDITLNLGDGSDVVRIYANEGTNNYTINLGADASIDDVELMGEISDYTIVDNGSGSYTFTHNETGSVVTFNNLNTGDHIEVCSGDCGSCSSNGFCKLTMGSDGKLDLAIHDGTADSEYIVNNPEAFGEITYNDEYSSDSYDDLILGGTSNDWTYDMGTDTYTHETYGTTVSVGDNIENVSFKGDMLSVDSTDTVDIDFSTFSLEGVTADFNKLVEEEGAAAAFYHISDLLGQMSTQLADQGLDDQALMFDKLRSATHNMAVVAVEIEEMINLTNGDYDNIVDLYSTRSEDFVKPVEWDDTYYSFEANTDKNTNTLITYATFCMGYATGHAYVDFDTALDQDYQAWEARNEYENIMADGTLSQEVKDVATELFSALGNMGETFQNKTMDLVNKTPDVTSSNSTYDAITAEDFSEHVSSDMDVRWEDYENYNAFNVTSFTGALQNIATGEDYSTYTSTTGDDSLEIAGGFVTLGSVDMGDGDDFVEITAHNSTVGSTGDRVDLGDGEDTLVMMAYHTDAFVDMGDDDDVIYLGGGTNPENSSPKYLDVVGGAGDDTLILEGTSSDWTYDSGTSTYSNYNSAAQVKISSIENVFFSEDTITIEGTTASDIIDTSRYINAEDIVINAYGQADDIYLDDATKTADYTLNLDSDAKLDSIYVEGSISDYNFGDNGDGTVTLTNNVSGSTITLNEMSAGDIVYFTDGDMSYESDDNWDLYLNDTAGADSYTVNNPTEFEDIQFNYGTSVEDTLVINDSISNWNQSSDSRFYETNAGTDAQSIEFDGLGTIEFNDYTFVKAGATDDTIDLTSLGSNQVVQVQGGDGEDTMVLAGAATDWTFDDSTETFTHKTTGQTIEAVNIEHFAFEDGIYNGTDGSDTYFFQSTAKYTGEINTGDGNDTVWAKFSDGGNEVEINTGAGNDAINIFSDYGTGDSYTVSGGEGNDTITLDGNISNYNIVDNGDGTHTLTDLSSSNTITFDSTVETVEAADGTLFTNAIVINGTAGDDTIDATGYSDETIIVNALEGKDSISIDTSSANTYNIDLGSGSEEYEEILVNGSLNDFSLVDNSDGTFTLNNNETGAVVNISNPKDNLHIRFDDGHLDFQTASQSFDVVYSNTAGVDTYDLGSLTNSNFDAIDDVRMTGGTTYQDTMLIDDSISNWNKVSDSLFTDALSRDVDQIDFSGVGTLEFNDYAFIKSADTGENINLSSFDSSKDIEVVGGAGTDTVTLAGESTDWTYDGTDTYTNNTSGQTVQIANVENVAFSGPASTSVKEQLVEIDGSIGSNTIDATTYDNSEINIDAYNGNDVIDVAGDNNLNVINAGTGNDIVNLTGTNSDSTVDLSSGDDSVFVGAGSSDTVSLIGGTGDDTLTLQGADTDWTFDGTDTYTNNITGTTVQATDFETVEYTQVGLSGNIDDYIIHDRVADGVIKVEHRVSGDITDVGDGDVIKFADGSVLELGNGDNIATITGTDSGSYVEVDDTYGWGVYNSTLGDGDDTFIMTGSENTTNTDLGAGDDTVFISEGVIGEANHAVLEGGAGNDTLQLDGDANNWTFDGTDTYTNVHTGTTVQATGFENVTYQDSATQLTGSIDDYIIHDRVADGVIKIEKRSDGTTYDMESPDVFEFEDGSRIQDVDGTLYITNSDVGNTVEIDDTYGQGTYNATLGAGDDDFIMTGSWNSSNSDLGAGNDTAYISAGIVSQPNNVTLEGGAGNDTLTLEGSATDWTFDGNDTYTHNTTGSTVSISNFENVYFEDDAITINGTSGSDTIDATGYSNQTININALEDRDFIYVDDMTNTNIFNIDFGSDSEYNRVFVEGNASDYTLTDNGDQTYTLTNNTTGTEINLNGLSPGDYVYYQDSRMIYENDDNWDLIFHDDNGLDNTYEVYDHSVFEAIDTSDFTSVNDKVVINDSFSNWEYNLGSNYINELDGSNDCYGVKLGTAGTVEFNDQVYMRSDSSSDNIDLTAYDGTGKDIRVDGGDGADSVTLAGSASDWTFDRDTDTYTNISTGQTVEINDVETVNYADSSDVVDIHSDGASLLGVSTNFNNLVATDGVSAAYAQISDMYGQLRDEMTDQGLTDQATTFDKMASAAYNQSLIAAEYESIFDATGGDPTAIQALYDSRDTTLMTEPAGWDDTYYTFEEDTIKNYIYDMAPMGSAANSGSLSTIVADEDRLVYELYYEYENVMADAAISDDVKALAQELTSANGNMGESFQNVVSNIIYIAPTSSNTNGINDAITGDSYQQFIASGAEAHWESYDSYTAENVSSYTDGLINIATGEDYSSFTGTTGADSLNITTGFETIGSFDMSDGNDTLSIAGHNNDIGTSGDRVLMGAGNDTLNYDGFNNDSYIDMGDGDDMAFVRSEGRIDGNINTLDVTGGAGNDTLVLEGSASDWYAVDGDTYRSYNTNTTVNYSGFENIVYSDDGISLYDGTSGDDIFESTTNSNLGVVSTDDSQDYVAFSGDDNEVTIRLGGGSDLAEIDTSGSNSNYVVDAGTGYDALMLSGNIADYNFVDNGDGTYTITDINSGSTITIDDTVEDVYAADGVLSDMGSDDYGLIVYNSNDQELHLDNYSDIAMEAYMEEGNDTVYMGGDNLQNVGLGDGDDTAYIDASEGGTFYVNGNDGNDTVNITGSIDDYTIGQTSWSQTSYVKLTNNVTGSISYLRNVDTLNFEDGSQITDITTSGSIGDITGTIGDDVVNVVDYIVPGDDIYNADLGAGNDSFSINGVTLDSNVDLGAGDDSIYVSRGTVGENGGDYNDVGNTIVVDGNTGSDTLTLQGDAAEWTFDGTDTYTHVNTGTTVQVSNIENVVYDDSDVVHLTGTIEDYNFVDDFDSIYLEDKSTSDRTSVSMNSSVIFDDGGILTLTQGNGEGYFFSGTGDATLLVADSYEGGISTSDGNDDITLEGYNHAGVEVNAGAGDDNIYIAKDENFDGTSYSSRVTVYGGDGTDTLTLEGPSEEWEFDGTDRYYNLSTDQYVTIQDIENVVFDDSNTSYSLSSSNFNITSVADETYSVSGVGSNVTNDQSVVFGDGSTFTVASDDDAVSFVGTSGNNTLTIDDDTVDAEHYVYMEEGDDTVTIDDTVAGEYEIYGGDGTDTLNLAGDTSDYNVVDNGDGSYTLTNTISGAVIKVGADVETVRDGFSTIMDLAGLSGS